MTRFATTLWDLLKTPLGNRGQNKEAVAADKPVTKSRRGPANTRKSPMQDRYDALVLEMKAAYGLKVRKWRGHTSGCAWEVKGADGSLTRMIESPYPRGPMSCAVFLHEVGHHAIGFQRYRPRCLEEYHAWAWALDMMKTKQFNITQGVLRRRDAALQYAVAKASRRGLKRLPNELLPWKGDLRLAENVHQSA